ncbi:MAG: bifunctional diaminohydroxyphosphoribosylaminopyrimidine deaminase/5-amino-6-(5-phosphoribosylamino)uracil reductase RibD [Candidatus Nanopelagicaceae bacterium]|nr:bifunctional diaminohydroxyphosphoribosylaminopyrimidine deaminase/5-amino-6-(5-phosphoribosylamino)uracil reductase RibD [Candidatus Nanopelagicaceae bacterium]
MKQRFDISTINIDRLMLRANELSKKGLGLTSPNPIVGAVIVDSGGNEIATGFHAGGEHAEIAALNAAKRSGKKDFSDCAILITLEPCNHFGKTPPCTDALIEAGFAAVVFAVNDPNQIAAGGAEKISNTGMTVISGVQEDLVSATNRAWLNKVNRKRPWFVSKIAATLDGKISAQDGSSKWITSAVSRADVALLRNQSDAILTGTGTVLADDPQLIPRFTDAKNPSGRISNPERIVLGNTQIPSNFKVHDATAATHFLKTHDFAVVLELANTKGWNQILVEAGNKLNSALFQAGLVDEIQLYFAPGLLGSGTNFISNLGINTLADRIELSFGEIERVGPDLKMQIFTASHAWLSPFRENSRVGGSH